MIFGGCVHKYKVVAKSNIIRETYERRGYSYRDIYEKAPDGWTKSYGKDLCPVCSDTLEELIEDFWKVED